jgi:DNA-binding IclR family transcriptional regulator
MASSLSKMLTILDLYDEEHPARTAEEICAERNFSVSSGYRYIRELCAAGLLTRAVGGTYMLGIRIVELEYVMRVADPIGRIGSPLLKRLAVSTGCDALLSSYHGMHVVNLLHERGTETLNVTYVRGRTHPLFRGAVAKAILPFLARSQLVKMYEAYRSDVAAAGMGQTWLEFWQNLQAIKKNGFSESHGELDPDLLGVGVPVFVNGTVVGSITAVFSRQRSRMLNREGLMDHLRLASRKLTSALERQHESEQASTARA